MGSTKSAMATLFLSTMLTRFMLTMYERCILKKDVEGSVFSSVRIDTRDTTARWEEAKCIFT